MKYAVAAALFALAAAQTRDDIPSCATPCLDDAVKASTSCSTTDYSCICPHLNDLVIAATPCVLKACGQDVALGKVLPAAKALCAAQGSSPASSSAPASTSSAPAKEASAAASSSAPATSAPAATTTPASKSTSWTSIPCDTTTTLASQTHSGNQTVPTSVPVTGGAAGLSAGVAAIALAALAL
ncbi:CFEMdomain-containing protein [Cordyceps javanica]|uniref:CFEMdomain-containing protein n=1 Tax=Cordyceps javanica TaxID=43265 RepID=A0A545VPR2_9HYPO|nr:CFEMdomain-containing protein [Cordyceps javanica]TQW03635.1 CFEM domain-containing protein [Cordyceps javanica]